MKLIVGLILLWSVCSFADNITTLDGTTYRDVSVINVEDDGISVIHDGGGKKIKFFNLPEDIRKKYNYDPVKAEVAEKASVAAAAEKAAAAKVAAAGWRVMDQRMIFLSVQLSSVEASLAAINRTMDSLGLKQAERLRDATRARQANTDMDLNAGGPVPWRTFYGRTAEKFFYHPTDKRTSYHTITILGQRSASDDVSPKQGMASRQGLPIASRPPQLDYIYRANTDAEQRALAEVARLGNNADALLARRRALEAEQSALWGKISFHAIAGQELLSKPLYYYDLKIANANSAESRQRLEAVKAAMDYLRNGNRLIAMVEQGVDADAARCYSQLQAGMVAARGEMEKRLRAQPTLTGDMTNIDTPLGKLTAVAKRMSEITTNIVDAYRLALDGDRTGDQNRKLTFRSQLQQSQMLCAEALLAGDECVNDMAREWQVVPAMQTVALESTAVKSSLVVPQTRPTETAMQSRDGASITIKCSEAVRILPLNIGQPTLYDRSIYIKSISPELTGWQFVSIPWHKITAYEIRVNQDGVIYAFGGGKDRTSKNFLGTKETEKWETANEAISGSSIHNCLRRKVAAGEIIKVSGMELQLAAKNIELLNDQIVKLDTQASAPPAPVPAVATTQDSVMQSGQQWTNSLGMKFVPVPGTSVQFSIWDTRVQDYQEFVTATGRKWEKPDFEQGPTHPAVNVSWDDAKAFCAWLTEKERKAGALKSSEEYRLPTDLEWSTAVGLKNETGSTPKERSDNGENSGIYSWGTQWPPPSGAGNFGDKTNDDFAKTSPVGSFAANQFGLYDMGGNVWQWCEDFYDKSLSSHARRGSSWRNGLYGGNNRWILSSWRGSSSKFSDKRMNEQGFRCVLTNGGVSTP